MFDQETSYSAHDFIFICSLILKRFKEVKRKEEVRNYWIFVWGDLSENGQGSATDMARRKRVRQTSEREVGMLDMVYYFSTLSEIVCHPDILDTGGGGRDQK